MNNGRDPTYDTPLPVYYERAPVQCVSCKLPDAAWSDDDLWRGWRMLGQGKARTKEYHCHLAFYEQQ